MGWIACSRPTELPENERNHIDELLAACAPLAVLVEHVRTFADMLTSRRGADLEDWMNAVESSDLPALHAFTRGLRKDLDAVVAGLSLPLQQTPDRGHQHQAQALEAADVRTGRLRAAPTADLAQLTPRRHNLFCARADRLTRSSPAATPTRPTTSHTGREGPFPSRRRRDAPSRSSNAPVVVANVLISARRPPRAPGTRTHAFTALPMSIPAHRSTRHSTLITTHPSQFGSPGGPSGPRRKDVESRARSNNQGRRRAARNVQLRVGLEAPVWNDVTGPPPAHFIHPGRPHQRP
jgi:hypothetical protein